MAESLALIRRFFRLRYSIDSCIDVISLELILFDKAKIPEEAVNKALTIAMNYLIENMETTDQEEPE